MITILDLSCSCLIAITIKYTTMNQPLNYVVNGTRYYYDLKISQWYILDQSDQRKYLNPISKNELLVNLRDY